MSKRTSIVKALVEKLKDIDGTSPYKTNLFNNAYPKLKFWDEIQDFPAVYVTPGTEVRDYLPGEFKWGFLGVAIKVYVRGDDAPDQLEALLEDIELVIDQNRNLIYDVDDSKEITEILIQSIVTDEGLLTPYGVGEVNLQVRYAIV